VSKKVEIKPTLILWLMKDGRFLLSTFPEVRYCRWLFPVSVLGLNKNFVE